MNQAVYALFGQVAPVVVEPIEDEDDEEPTTTRYRVDVSREVTYTEHATIYIEMPDDCSSSEIRDEAHEVLDEGGVEWDSDNPSYYYGASTVDDWNEDDDY